MKESKELTITQTEWRRLTVHIDEDGIAISETRYQQGSRMPPPTVYLSDAELGRIAKQSANFLAKQKRKEVVAALERAKR